MMLANRLDLNVLSKVISVTDIRDVVLLTKCGSFALKKEIPRIILSSQIKLIFFFSILTFEVNALDILVI